MRRVVLLCCTLLLPSCGVLPVSVPDTARLLPGQLGTGFDPDVAAVYQAQWAFADPGRTRNRPIDAARAVAAMDYIAGALNTSPRWANIPAVTQMQLLQGRAEMRQVLGIVPNAPSQAVVDRFTGVADALSHGDQRAALADLSAPIFTAPAPVMFARLNDLPYMPEVNVSTMRAANALFQNDRSSWR